MARSRNIKPGFCQNEYLAELPIQTRLLFALLPMFADREGRLEDRPKKLKVQVFPYDEFDMDEGLSALEDYGFLLRYSVDGFKYIQIKNWAKHQNPHHKEVASEIPAPKGHKDTVCKGYIPLSNTIRNRVYERDGRVCANCGTTENLSIDHIIPVSMGGNSVDENLQVLCRPCNTKKGQETINYACTSHAQAMHEPSMDDEQTNESGCSPLVTDSLLLIPDSMNKTPLSTPLALTGDEKNSGPDKPPPCPHQEIIAIYHETLPELPRVVESLWPNSTDAANLQARWRSHPEHQDLDFWRGFFEVVRTNPHWMGENDRGWKANLRWLVNKTNFTKVAERWANAA